MQTARTFGSPDRNLTERTIHDRRLCMEVHLLGRICDRAHMMWILPSPVLVRCIFHSFGIQVVHHPVKFALPQLFKPFSMSKPFDQRRTDSVVNSDKHSAIPCFSQRIVAVTPQRPHLRTVVRTVNGGSNIAPAILLLFPSFPLFAFLFI